MLDGPQAGCLYRCGRMIDRGTLEVVDRNKQLARTMMLKAIRGSQEGLYSDTQLVMRYGPGSERTSSDNLAGR